MRVCFFGAYNPSYPRHTIIKNGLERNKVRISECWLPPKYKFWVRYPLFLFQCLISRKRYDCLFVPEFCQKDVPIAKFLSLITSARLIFDPLASRYETKIIDWRRNPEKSWQARWNHFIDRWAFRLSDLVLADTEAHRDYYSQKFGFSLQKIIVLPVGFDDSLFRPVESETRRDSFTVLFFGSFLPLHGADEIVRAAKIVFSQDPSIRFKLIGSGQTLPQVKALASELECRNISFDGWMPQEKLPQVIASADISLGIFGQTEKAGRVVPHKVFRALAMKRAVVTARTPASEEFFSHCKNIFFCSDPFPESLSQAILELRRNKALREKIAEEGYKLVWEKYSPDKLGLSLKKVLKEYFPEIQGKSAIE